MLLLLMTCVLLLVGHISAIAVEPLAPRGVRQHFVSFDHLCELSWALGAVRVAVRVILPDHGVVCLLHILRCRITGHVEHLIVINSLTIRVWLPEVNCVFEEIQNNCGTKREEYREEHN